MLFARQVLRPLLASIALATLGSAADSSYGSSATATASSSITTTFSTSTTTSTGSATHTVQVGPDSSPHAYVPHSITANPGDVVVFEFYPTNHSVVQADYGSPCRYPSSGAYFYSGIFNSFNEKDGQLVGPVGLNILRPESEIDWID